MNMHRNEQEQVICETGIYGKTSIQYQAELEVRESLPSLDFLSDFKRASPFLRVIFVGKGDKKLQGLQLPTSKVMDLTLAVCLLLQHKGGSFSRGLIQKGWLSIWGVDEEELFQTAIRNTIEKSPLQICPMDQILFGALENEALESPLLVCSNEMRYQGAAAIFYPGAAASACKRMGVDGIYILPSSVHETILLPDQPEYEPLKLGQMIWQVNREVVSEEDCLSDQLYRYDLATDQISQVFGKESCSVWQ